MSVSEKQDPVDVAAELIAEHEVYPTCSGYRELALEHALTLARAVLELAETRQLGSCQCGDDEACKFARERDEARAEVERLRAALKAVVDECRQKSPSAGMTCRVIAEHALNPPAKEVNDE
jgi:hypothetical protein